MSHPSRRSAWTSTSVFDVSRSSVMNIDETPVKKARPSYLWLPETAERIYNKTKEAKPESPFSTHFAPTSVLLEMKFDVESLSFEVSYIRLKKYSRVIINSL